MPVLFRIIAVLLVFSAGLVRSDTLKTTYITLASAVYEDSLISARTRQRSRSWMYHCHVIEHMKTGLMGYLRIS